MKNKNLLFSTISLGLLASVVFTAAQMANVSEKYTPRSAKGERPTVDEAAEYYKSLRLNGNGVYDEQLIKNTRDQVKAQIAAGEFARTANFHWYEEGPDNIGGRTRAITIDRFFSGRVWAGSVSGGLFVSSNGGNTWGRVDSFDQTLAIASMGQTRGGRLFVGTGFGGYFNEYFSGDGLFYSDDNGTTWIQVPSTSNFNWVEIIPDPVNPNKIWCATSNGLKIVEGTSTLTVTNVAAPGGGQCFDVKVSPDGNVIVCAVASAGIRTWVSTDAGATFTNVSGSGTGQIPASGVGRIEYAISFEKNSINNWNIYASSIKTNSTLFGQYFSDDNGLTWAEIAPASSAGFDPFISANGQGIYNNVISAVPGRPDQALLGGIDVYAWNREQGLTPAFGQWEQRSLWFASPLSPVYVHADNHEMEWDENNILYIGNDGGIGKSPDKGNLFFPANRGYNVTQFYGIGFSADGDVIGGTQDNGTLLNRHTGVTMLTFEEVRGGDGFDCDISHMNPDVMFASVYTGDMQRSDDGGFSFSPFFTPPTNAGFKTVGRLYENPKDFNSLETVGVQLGNSTTLAGDILVPAGDTVWYVSKTFQTDLFYITPTNIVASTNGANIIQLQDYVQSLYAIALASEVRITRQALRFSAAPSFTTVLTGEFAQCLEFSHDGNHLFVGTSDGDVWRISGLNTVYAPVMDLSSVTTTRILQSAGASVEGIAIDMNDPEHVVITLSGYSSNRVRESTTAASTMGTSSFSSIHGNLPNIPVYDAIINVNNPDQVIVGTEFGVYVTDNINATSTQWTFQSQVNGPWLVPVYSVRQQWRKWEDGTNRPGEVYIGTFGRGIWRTEAFLSVKENDLNSSGARKILNVAIYPNPMQDNGRITFDLDEAANVNVSIYNISGQMVRSIALGNRPEGKLQVDVNVADLSNGTYIVRAQAGANVYQGRLVVTH